jgi:hypothetical protein
LFLFDQKSTSEPFVSRSNRQSRGDQCRNDGGNNEYDRERCSGTQATSETRSVCLGSYVRLRPRAQYANGQVERRYRERNALHIQQIAAVARP